MNWYKKASAIYEIGDKFPHIDGAEAIKLKDGKVYWTFVMNHYILIQELKSRHILTDDNFYDLGWVDEDGVFTAKETSVSSISEYESK